MIITPQQLWKDYDRESGSLNTVLVHEGGCADGHTFKHVYFNGEQGEGGITRIFAKLYTPKGGTNACVMVLDDVQNSVDSFSPDSFLASGLGVLVVDYGGESAHHMRYTLYPKNLRTGNFIHNHPSLLDFDSPKESCWYIWATVALRALTFLESEGYTRRFMLGIGHGGEQVWKLCYFEDELQGGATIFSGGVRAAPHSHTANEIQTQYLKYKASLDSSAYANAVKAPVFMLSASNEPNGSFDHQSELFETALTQRPTYFSVMERSSRQIPLARFDYLAMWFTDILANISLPVAPKASVKASQNKLCYEVSLASTERVSEVSLFVAHAQKNAAFRNWRTVPLQMVSEGGYLAFAPVFLVDEPVYAFVNVTYECGLVQSSALNAVTPKNLGIAAPMLQPARRVYDSDMGLSDWLIDSPQTSAQLLLDTGPFDLSGITSTAHKLSTFRLCDPQFKGSADASLQLTLYSPIKQTVLIHVLSAQSHVAYTCAQELSADDKWTKWIFSASDFKSAEGALQAWDEVLTFSIESTATVLVNSLLWV